MKTFKYKNHEKCYFYVDSYKIYPDVIYFRIENDTCEMITDCTKFHMFTLYEKNSTNIVDLEMVKFLKELKIVTKVIEKVHYGNFSGVLYHCKINIKKLKEYSKEWHFEYA